jgi:hypothetical protein
MTIEAGTYMMRATDAELGFTAGGEGKDSKPQVAVLLEFVDGPHKGSTLTWYGYFTEKSKPITVRALRALGMQGNNIAEALDTIRGETSCVVEVENDLEGNARPRVRWVGQGGSLAMKKPMSEHEKAAFSASLQATFAAVPASKADAPF